MIQLLSDIIGISPVVVRLLLSVLVGYPISLLYRFLYLKTDGKDRSSARNLFIAVSGISISLFFNHYDFYHSLLTVVLTYSYCLIFGTVMGNRTMAAIVIFLFNIIYLLSGYWYISNKEYDLSWTLPQCVLCLRMIGFGMDYMDGDPESFKNKKEKPKEIKSKDKKEENKTEINLKPKASVSFSGDCSLKDLPPFMEFLGYSYFYSAFLVGPQFSFALYHRFINLKNMPIKDNELPQGAIFATMKCFLLGLIYMAMSQIIEVVFPTSFLLTENFSKETFFMKLVYVWLGGKAFCLKYLAIWVINEGACVLSGITYNGKNSNGTEDWSGLSNINLYAFETATSLNDYILSFNINTNFWVKQYVFKRLIFLKNKDLSSLGTLLFLALWHGFHIGYYVNFLMEFFYMAIENKYKPIMAVKVQSLYRKEDILSKLSTYLINLFCWTYTSFGLHYALISFGFLHWDLFIFVWKQVYFVGHIIPAILLLGAYLMPRYKKVSLEKKSN